VVVGLADRGGPFVEGDREVAAEGRATIRLIIRIVDQSCYDFVDVVGDEWLCPVVRLIGFESEFDYGNSRHSDRSADSSRRRWTICE
jgi:hypothetical protein